MVRLRLPPRYRGSEPNMLSDPRSHTSNVRRRHYPGILHNVQRRTRIQPELLRTSEEEAVSGLVPSMAMELDDEQPVMVSRDTNDSEHSEIDSDEVCCLRHHRLILLLANIVPGYIFGSG